VQLSALWTNYAYGALNSPFSAMNYAASHICQGGREDIDQASVRRGNEIAFVAEKKK
jgi:hypothetical protein